MAKQLNIKSTILNQKCAKCSDFASKIEIIEAHSYPESARLWTIDQRLNYEKYRDFDSLYLTYAGPGGSSGDIGTPINENRKAETIKAFTRPYDPVKIQEQFYDMAGYCVSCQQFYCSTHWNINSRGYGKCPNGHGQSLDPHWTPDYEEDKGNTVNSKQGKSWFKRLFDF